MKRQLMAHGELRAYNQSVRSSTDPMSDKYRACEASDLLLDSHDELLEVLREVENTFCPVTSAEQFLLEIVSHALKRAEQ